MTTKNSALRETLTSYPRHPPQLREYCRGGEGRPWEPEVREDWGETVSPGHDRWCEPAAALAACMRSSQPISKHRLGRGSKVPSLADGFRQIKALREGEPEFQQTVHSCVSVSTWDPVGYEKT